MPSESNPLSAALGRVLNEVQGWPGVTLAPHRFGGTEFRLGKGEIGHSHPDGSFDIPFPKPVRDELVAKHRAEPHHVLPRSGWVTFRLRTEADVPHAIELLRLAYEVRQTVASKPVTAGADPDRPGGEPAAEDESPCDRALDEAVEESFPASDPPAVSHIHRAHR